MTTILVIDDDPDMVMAARMALERAGYRVIDARNGAAGLAKIKVHRPDLIILDVMMESMTEGFELALKLRNPDPESEYAEYASIPILMLTAIHSTTPLRFGADEVYLPVDAFIEKPLNPNELVQKVEVMLAARKVES
jgi:CheY-like chemotaxis protein